MTDAISPEETFPLRPQESGHARSFFHCRSIKHICILEDDRKNFRKRNPEILQRGKKSRCANPFFVRQSCNGLKKNGVVGSLEAYRAASVAPCLDDRSVLFERMFRSLCGRISSTQKTVAIKAPKVDKAKRRNRIGKSFFFYFRKSENTEPEGDEILSSELCRNSFHSFPAPFFFPKIMNLPTR